MDGQLSPMASPPVFAETLISWIHARSILPLLSSHARKVCLVHKGPHHVTAVCPVRRHSEISRPSNQFAIVVQPVQMLKFALEDMVGDGTDAA